MNIFTHFLLPVTAKQSSDLLSKEFPGYKEQLRGWIVIGVFGILPDILDPHLTLAERCDSFTHVWPFTAVVLISGIICYFLLRKKEYASLCLWCAAAYLLHVLGDIISGGLDFFGTGHAIGDYWISPVFWPLCDLVLIVIFIFLNRRIRKIYGLDPSIIREMMKRFNSEND